MITATSPPSARHCTDLQANETFAGLLQAAAIRNRRAVTRAQSSTPALIEQFLEFIQWHARVLDLPGDLVYLEFGFDLGHGAVDQSRGPA